MNITEVQEGRAIICRSILEALPEWFGIQEARESYIRQADTQPMLACIDGGQPVGMLTMIHQSRMNLEIAVMGVLPSHHRQGVGTALIRSAKIYATEHGAKMLSVKTVADSSPNPRYAQTRAFYRAMGFELFEVFPDLWDEHNPCALLVLPVMLDSW